MRYELADCERFAIRPMLPNKLRGVPRVNHRRGLPVQLALTAGEAHDNRLAGRLLSHLKSGTMLLADRGYDADWIRALASKRGAWANIPPRCNRNKPICFAPKPPSSACAQRCGWRLTTPMQCSTSRCCYNEKTNTQKPQIIGVAISPAIANPNGPHGRADH